VSANNTTGNAMAVDEAAEDSFFAHFRFGVKLKLENIMAGGIASRPR
jgi:hypothetical protein